jgi:hypothetical protein
MATMKSSSSIHVGAQPSANDTHDIISQWVEMTMVNDL